MGWAYCGTDTYGRKIGYGIKAYCDYPGCNAVIDRGLSYVCGDFHGGDDCGCGRYFCEAHLTIAECSDGEVYQLCEECYKRFEDEEVEMNAKKLDMDIFRCEKCYKLWATEEDAETCCKKGSCKYCGTETPFIYVPICRECRTHLNGARATEQEHAYAQEFDYKGPVYDPYSEKFYESLGCLEEVVEDTGVDMPPYVVKCNVLFFRVDAQRLVENAFEDYASQLDDPDDVDIVDFGELVAFINSWNKKQTAKIWEPSHTVIVLSEEWLCEWEEKHN